MRTAVVLLFHGSRAEGARETVHRIVSDIRKRGGYDLVSEAFLQHGNPTLIAAVAACAKQHAGQIIIVPFFLQVGTHVTADIPALVKEVTAQHPKLQIILTDAVGSHPLMADIVLDLVRKRGAA